MGVDCNRYGDDCNIKQTHYNPNERHGRHPLWSYNQHSGIGGGPQQTLKQLGEPANGAALSCAVTYPLGVVGVILAMLVVRKAFCTPIGYRNKRARRCQPDFHCYF